MPSHGGPAPPTGSVRQHLSIDYATPPTCGGHVLTGADGPRNPLGMVATPPGNPWGVVITTEVWLVPMGAGTARGGGVSVAKRSRALQDAGATSPANALEGCTPYSGLRTGIDVGFVGSARKPERAECEPRTHI